MTHILNVTQTPNSNESYWRRKKRLLQIPVVDSRDERIRDHFAVVTRHIRHCVERMICRLMNLLMMCVSREAWCWSIAIRGSHVQALSSSVISCMHWCYLITLASVNSSPLGAADLFARGIQLGS